MCVEEYPGDDDLECAGPSRASRGKSKSFHRYFRVEDIAEQLQIHPRTVRRWIEKKLLAATRIGGVLRISEPDLLAFLARYRE